MHAGVTSRRARLSCLAKGPAPRVETIFRRPLLTTSLSSQPPPFHATTLPMFLLDESVSPKRRRSSLGRSTADQQHCTKRRKSSTEDQVTEPGHRPASFWNSLTKIWLTRSALREFSRREACSESAPKRRAATSISQPGIPARSHNERFARHGGPDLSHLRGVS